MRRMYALRHAILCCYQLIINDVNLCDDAHHLMLFQSKPAGDKCGPCGRPGAREHRVGDPLV